jgi:hypothetical protein
MTGCAGCCWMGSCWRRPSTCRRTFRLTSRVCMRMSASGSSKRIERFFGKGGLFLLLRELAWNCDRGLHEHVEV